MAKQKLDKELSAKFAEFLKLREAAKTANNAVNREKTVLKNVFKDGIKNRAMVIGTYVLHGGYRFDYSQTESSVIEPEDFLKLLEAGEITRDQFLRCISVQKGNVDTHVGSDVGLRLSKSKTGKEFDVRVSELDIDAPRESVLVVPDAEKPIVRKKPLSRKTTSLTPAKTSIKRVKIKTKK